MLYLDFEYSRSSEPFVRPICCCTLEELDGRVVRDRFWLLDPQDRQRFLDYVCVPDVLCSFQAGAEARALRALGLAATEFAWVDLYCEWLQARNGNDSCRYGRYYIGGHLRTSTPPKMQPGRNRGKNNTEVGTGLADAVGHQLGICIDSERKRRMRELVISDPVGYTDAQREELLEYCASDVEHLPELRRAIRASIVERLPPRYPPDRLDAEELARGQWSVLCSEMETVGIPVDVEALRNLGRNHDEVVRRAIEGCLEDGHAPFWRLELDEGRHPSEGRYVRDMGAFEAYLAKRGLLRDWPRTEKGALSTDEDTLKEYEGDAGISSLRETSKAIRQVGYFRPESRGDIEGNLGSDGRLRVFLAPYGTQTARCAPQPKKGYVFAMSSWLRALIKPPEGYSIVAADYGAQEFAIAAVLSGDANMMVAYSSGDPYLHFAKITRMVPSDATKETHPFERDLAKSLVLGLQFGMGRSKLAAKLTADLGREFREDEAQAHIDSHKKAFPDLWRWRAATIRKYRRERLLSLPDGWHLFGDNPSDLSAVNFPIQGMGSTILREAVRLLGKSHAAFVFAPLHDAVYSLCRSDMEERACGDIRRAMRDAFRKHLGDALEVRIDMDIHRHGQPWVEKKGEKWYRRLGFALEPIVLPDDRKRMMSEWLDKSFV